MMQECPKDSAPQFLSGWKEIASYLGKGVRTVQRYERRLGLPVRRPAGKPSGSVLATRAELDAWVSASPIREVYRLSGLDVESEYVAAADNFQLALKRMKRLRDEMLWLRNEVRSSVRVLRNSVHDLQGALNQNWWRDRAALSPSTTVKELEQASGDLPLLQAPVKYPKAS
ncbi:MAG TPA: hypothetical protein VMU05_15535 [Dongiaceae bacterium]|nr:hypothetical protein [Dongiaceae bacterium]